MTIINLGTRVVNNYLVSTEIGYILIDTGYAGGFPRLIKQLRKNGIDPKEISYVFLTHAHDDHTGFLNEVLELTGAQVILHPKAIEGLKRGRIPSRAAARPDWPGCSARCWPCLDTVSTATRRFEGNTSTGSSLLIPSGLKRCTSLILCWKRRDTQPIISRCSWTMCCSVGTRP